MKKIRNLTNILIMIAGILLMSMALHLFFQPFEIVPGGVTGLGIILEAITDTPLWVTNLIANLPLFIWAYFVFDKGFVLRSGIAAGLLSLFLYLMEALPTIEGDYITSALFGGAIYGVGIGMVLRTGTTTGGTDLAAGIINRLIPHIRVSIAMLWLDAAIIALGFGVFGGIRAMYGMLAAIVMTRSVDPVLEGFSYAKAAFIITSKGEAVGGILTKELERGCTLLQGAGVYSGKDKQVLILAAGRKQIPRLRELTRQIDEDSFVFVTDIREIMGKFRK